jgi:hypothetical protein
MKKENEYINHLLIENQYFGSVNYINTLFYFSNIEIEQYEAYKKMSFRNRCVVVGSNGLVNLSVPLEKGRSQKLAMKEVRISYSEDWQKRHLRTLESCYSRAPFFEFYQDGVWNLFGKSQTFLLDLNMEILSWLKTVLKIPAAISLSGHYHGPVPQNVTDLRNHFLPRNYLNQPAGLRYTQVFEDRIGFMPNLCILDLLFCCGPEATLLLSQTSF